jgi:hypothetical protein
MDLQLAEPSMKPSKRPQGGMGSIHEGVRKSPVRSLVKRDALGRFSVPAGPAGLLVVGLRVTGRDRADVRLVDPHARRSF